MPLDVLFIVLCAAALHAGWNGLVRSSSGGFQDTALIVLGAGICTVFFLPLVPPPVVKSLPYLGASVLVHVVYFVLVALSYRSGELSFVYPVMRGSAPVLSVIGAALLIGESPSPGGWVGVFFISSGIIVLTGDSVRSGRFCIASAMFALTNAFVIATYTLIDGQGARMAGNAFSYTGWMFLLTALLMLCILAGISRRALFTTIRAGWRKGLLGGACSLASYGLVLWAMTRAPIGLVAALRETSVIFAVIIATLLLKEPATRLRLVSIAAVTAGAVLIKLC